jgi:glycosyltransferase involved in cell wall biosynthesis
MVELSIVLISKNQEWNIARLIESVLTHTNGFRTEVILVDSASADRTVDIARSYPITILRLSADQRLTPSAGRYIGSKYAKGALLLFLDGDMELAQSWVQSAGEVLQANSKAAAVTGHVLDVSPSRHEMGVSAERIYTGTVTEASRTGGAVMIRRSVMQQVGSFNPYLFSEEEPELCLRIRHAGYRILHIDRPIAWHHSPPSEALTTLLGRWRRRLYLGTGQVLRYHFGTPLFWPYLRERGYGLAPGIGVVAILATLSWGLTAGRWLPLMSCSLAFAAFCVADAYRKGSAYLTMASLLKRCLILDGTVRGFLMKPSHPSTYSGQFDVVGPRTSAQSRSHEHTNLSCESA